MSKKKQGSGTNGVRNWARIILWTAAIVNIPRYAGAFIYADIAEAPKWLSDALNAANMVGGVAMGIIEAISIAFIMDGLRHTSLWSKSGILGVNWRWFVNLFFGMGMMLLAVLILVPFMNARMNGLQMREVLPNMWWQGGWNLFVVLAPIFIIAGASFSQSDFVHGNKSEGKPGGTETYGELAEDFPKDWRKMTKEHKKQLARVLRKSGGKKIVQDELGVSEKTADNYTAWLKREGLL
jgi:hypothetical protein